jgi:hypothetical protein
MLLGGLAKAPECLDFLSMEPAARELLARTEPPLRPNGERKLAHNILMQVTWGLLLVAGLGQLFLLVWLDVMS